MKTDIRKYTRVILRKNKQYLVCQDVVMHELKWSPSPFDAWHTRNLNDAKRIGYKIGAVPVLFNPVIRKVCPIC